MTKDKLKDISNEIQKALGLGEWRLSYGWFDSDDTGEEKDAAASMMVMPQYFQLRMNIYPKFFKEADVSQFEIILHEFCHALTEELYKTAVGYAQGKNYHQDLLENARERNTTMVNLALLNVICNSEKLSKIYKGLNASKVHNKTKV